MTNVSVYIYNKHNTTWKVICTVFFINYNVLDFTHVTSCSKSLTCVFQP